MNFYLELEKYKLFKVEWRIYISSLKGYKIESSILILYVDL